MQKVEWNRSDDWKARYSRLYSSRCLFLPKQIDERRISFLSKESSPYACLLMKLKDSDSDNEVEESYRSPSALTVLSELSDPYHTDQNSRKDDDLGGHDMMLLNMVRGHSRESYNQVPSKPLKLHGDNIEDETGNDVLHTGVRWTERSISRSRVSRMSTRRDMDIPSILAFTASITASEPAQLKMAELQKYKGPPKEEIPRWSIRRAVCPVCSNKWRDKSSITNVKNSGLKRSSTQDLPIVKAPARLRTTIALGYVPRPVLPAVDEDGGITHGGLRTNSASWQLTRARRFRTPKPQPLSPEASGPPMSTAPLARKDLDLRVNRFIKEVKKTK